MMTSFPLIHLLHRQQNCRIPSSILQTATRAAAALLLLAAGAPSAWAGSAPASTATTTTLALSSASVASGTAVTLTATVKAGATPVAAGRVNFCNASAAHCTDINLIGTAQLTSAGTAAFKFVAAPGAHSYKAVFTGTAAYTTSSSAASPLTVTNAFHTTTTLAPTGSAGNYTLKSTTTSVGNNLSPTGTVSFLDTSNTNYVLGTASAANLSTVLSFVNSSTPPTGTNPYAVAVADFNGDGIMDMAVVNNGNNSLSILLGVGDGTFTAAASPATGALPYAIAVADFNGDGIPDLAVANAFDGTVTILQGKGDGTFTVETPLNVGTGSNPVALVAADFNNDGNVDLAVTDTGNNTLAIFLGNGNSTFTAAASPATGTLPWAIATGDFNNDGIADLVVINATSSTLTVLQGVGDGTFTAKTPVVLASGSNPISIAVADFNADGKADLVIANFQTGVITPSTLAILLGNGDGTFTAAASPATGVNPNSVAIGDFNEDGVPDIAVANFGDNTVSVLFGTGTGTFTAGGSLAAGNNPYAVASGVFHADGSFSPAVVNFADNTISVFGSQFAQTATATVNNIAIVGTGSHSVEASYPGDSLYGGSVSAASSLTALPVVTTTTLTANPSSSAYSNTVTLTAIIAPVLAQTHVAGGSVTFYNGATSLATVPVTSNTVVTTISTLPVGTDSLTAVYTGDTNFATSTGASSEIVISNFTFAATTTTTPVLIPGQSAPYNLAIAPLPSASGYPGVITFTTSGLPTGATASFSPNSIAVNGGAQTVVMTIQTATMSAKSAAPAPYSPFLLGLLLLPLAGAKRFARTRKSFSRLLSIALLVAGLAAVVSVSGCGSKHGFFGQSPKSYTVTVTASGGTVAHNTTVNLTVQ